MVAPVSRREFLHRSLAFGAAALSPAVFSQTLGQGPAAAVPALDLAVARGDSPARNCLAAVEALGGFPRFVRSGDKVVVKPNPVGSNPPDRAINTHPEMVEAVVRSCKELGAREVVVLSHDEPRGFQENGIGPAVERAGGRILALSRADQFRPVVVPRGRILRQVELAADLFDADVFINMPIAKHHAGSRLTLAMKNLMGVNWDRITFHRTDLHQCIAELTTAVRHHLVIMDANHVLLSNGPSGPGRVLQARQVVAGVDPVAVDAFSCRYFDLKPEAVGHIRAAYELGAGEIDLAKLQIREFDA